MGVGIPIPILNEEMAAFTGVSNADILMPVKGRRLPERSPPRDPARAF
ncbi:MAG: homocysteine biosynthesis protein [Bilophila sp.]